MALRWLVLLVAVAAVLDISQAMFPLFKEKREQGFKRYLENLKERRAAAKDKRQFEEDVSCPLWDCYDVQVETARQSDEYEFDSDGEYDFSYDYSDDYLQKVSECMENLKKENDKLCNCTLDDIAYADMGDLLVQHDDTPCYDCLKDLPMPESYPFSCDYDKVDEAQTCFEQAKDKTCLKEILGGIDIEPQKFFDGIRAEMLGCPIQAIIEECMDFFKDEYYTRDKYTDCALRKAGVPAAGECVKQLASALQPCSTITEAMYTDITRSLDGFVETDCASLRPAIEIKAKCCGNRPARPEPAKKRRARKILERILKAKGL